MLCVYVSILNCEIVFAWLYVLVAFGYA